MLTLGAHPSFEMRGAAFVIFGASSRERRNRFLRVDSLALRDPVGAFPTPLVELSDIERIETIARFLMKVRI